MKDTAEDEKPPKTFQVFYDIGCTLEKSVKKVMISFFVTLFTHSPFPPTLINFNSFDRTNILRKNMHGEISGLQQVLFMRMLTSGLVN